MNKMCKGFFPHKFNLQNQDFEGDMPDPVNYDPDDMSAKKKAEWEERKPNKNVTGTKESKPTQMSVSSSTHWKLSTRSIPDAFFGIT